MPHDFASVPYEDRAKEIPFASAEYIAFASRSSFLGVPAKTLDDLGDGQVVILGAPFDWGASYRPGARFGPQAIRDADYGVMDGYRPHLPTGIDPLRTLGVVDIGDVYVVPGQVELSLERIIATVEKVTAAGKIPIVLGGDHTVTFANATGVTNVLGAGEIAVVHFDAHADTGMDQWGSLIGHGQPMRRLIEEGWVAGPNFVQVGLRGYWPDAETFDWMRDQGFRWHTQVELEERGVEAVIDEAIAQALDGPDRVYLSVDIDVVDPGMAPGTGTPESGGMLGRELLRAVRRIVGSVDLAGMDVVEVSPPYDHAEITAMLATNVVMEAISALAARRG